MAKTMDQADTALSSNNGTKKQRKKQAKREAKAMLKLEQSRKDVHKAEQKVARAQAKLEASTTRLRTLEAEVEKMHPTHSDSEAGTTSTDQQTPTQTDTGDYAGISTPTNQVASLPPVEGRTDVLQEESNSSSPAATNENTTQEESNSSSPAATNENTTQEESDFSDPIAIDENTSHSQEDEEEAPHDSAEAEDIHEVVDR